MRLVLVLCCLQIAHAFRITDISATDGEDVLSPAYSGDDAEDIYLTCRLELSPGDHWTSCSWSHQFPDLWGLTNSQGYVMCSVSSENDNQKQCQDVGNLKDMYGGYEKENEWLDGFVERLSHTVTGTTCGLKISRPSANDTGVWKCMVSDNSAGGSYFSSEIDLFVANKSEALITDPAMDMGMDQSLWIDVSDGQDTIEASCESVYGVPPPQLIWYIDEPSNQISDRDADITERTDSSGGSDVTVKTKSSISMDVDIRSLGTYGVRDEHGYFSFSLGCYPDQENYFSQSGSYVRNPAEVMVFGRSGGVVLHTSLAVLIAQILISYTLV